MPTSDLETKGSALATKGCEQQLGEDKLREKRHGVIIVSIIGTRETCWKLHDKQPNWKKKNRGNNRAFQSTI